MVAAHRVNRAAVIVACLTLIALVVPTSTEAQQKQPTPAQIAEWQRLAAPGAGHRLLAPLAGRWTLRISYGDGAGQATQTATGESEYKWVMGGRYLMEESRTTFGGQPFEWIGIHAFDNTKGKYTSAWVDNLGTQIDRLDGRFDAATKRLTYEGEEDHAGQGTVRIRWTIDFTSAESYRVTMAEIGNNGKEKVLGTIVATRAQ